METSLCLQLSSLIHCAPAQLEGVAQHALARLAAVPQHGKGVHLGALLVLEVGLVSVKRLAGDRGQVLSQECPATVRWDLPLSCSASQGRWSLPQEMGVRWNPSLSTR